MAWDAAAVTVLVALSVAWLARGLAKPACARCPSSTLAELPKTQKPCTCKAVPADRLTLGQKRPR